MTTRKITIITGIVIFAIAIVLFNILSSGPGEEAQSFTNGVTAIGVPVIEAKPTEITSEIFFTGRVIPKDKLELFAEVTGTLSQGDKPFKAGTSFKKGEVLMKIDDREQKQVVLTQKSQFQSLLTQILADISIDFPKEYDAWNSYLSEMDIHKELSPLPASGNKTFNLFLTGRGVNASYFSIKQSEVRLSKYTIVAPYDGVLTQSLLDPGTLVRMNQKMGEFTNIRRYEIEASIKANDRFFIKTGDMVQVLLSGSMSMEIPAEVARINAQIDPSTQTILVYLEVSGNGILSGQYITGSITGETFSEAQKISAKSLVRDNQVFLAKDSVATMFRVEVLANIRDSVIVKGLSTGDLVINEFRDAGFEGTKVAPLKN
ncbi:MAG: efflux RND transporter periplasmic adaptor subunit [Balneola sp.]